MKAVEADEAGLKEAVRFLKDGKSVVYPTDTCYGLAVDANNTRAVSGLFLIKGRTEKKPVHVIVGSLDQAKKLAVFNAKALLLFKKFFPGPLTIVLKMKSEVKNRESWKHLSAGTGTIGIRMPDNKIALELARKLGSPITTTSANISGKRSAYSIEEVYLQFRVRKHQPDLVINALNLPEVKPSTIVDLTQKDVRILREGPISTNAIIKACEKKR